MTARRKLQSSVMTSSSIRSLSDIFDEIRAVSNVGRFDLMILRDIDLEQIRKETGINIFSDKPNEAPAITRFLGEPEHFEPTRDWIQSRCHRPDVEIVALASYLPDVTSLCDSRREMAIEALVATTRIGLALTKQGTMPHPIIEMVCGTTLDPCECLSCGGETIYVYDRRGKIRLLCRSLDDVIQRVRDREGNAEASFTLALEMEPGETYVLNGLEPLETLADELAPDGEYHNLRQHVGFNLDIAHMKIAKISADQLENVKGLFVHAHISDHPGMHTRDQVVGTWTEIERDHSGYFDYLKLLADHGGANPLPFSGAVALELEGCNRMSWIHRSLDAMNHLFESVWSHP